MFKKLTFGKICFFIGVCILSVCIGISYRMIDGLAFLGVSLLIIGSIAWFAEWIMHT